MRQYTAMTPASAASAVETGWLLLSTVTADFIIGNTSDIKTENIFLDCLRASFLITVTSKANSTIATAEAPKLYRLKNNIRIRVAQLLGLPRGRVNIKAKTFEGLDIIGRKQALAALALVTLAGNRQKRRV